MSNKIKIAINAGHYKYTSGKRCLRKFDPKETREWVLNARVAEHLEKILKEKYTGFEIFRIDDRTGERSMTLKERTDKANKWGADIWIGIHHNAGINGGKGGGIVVYRYTKVGDYTKKLQKAIYDSIIKQTGLKGNRATPLAASDLHECRETAMPAVLIENGFMDSSADTPQIITDNFAYKSALGIAEGIAQICKISPKPSIEPKQDAGDSAEDIEAAYMAQIEELTDKLDKAYDLINQASKILK